METERPVVIIGAGPAGVAAARASARTAPTILLDERARPGGRKRWPDDAGDVQSLLDSAGVDYRPETTVWGIYPGPVVATFDRNRAMSIDAGAVVIATGSADRTWPVPGWHLDGVQTAGELFAAIEDGSFNASLRYGVIGHADEAAATAIEAAGGTVAIATSALEGVRIEGDTVVECLCRPRGCVDVDRVVLALGQRPDPSLALQARAASVFDRDALIDMPLLAEDGATSLPGVFVAGEAAGHTTLAETRDHGSIAGASAAEVANGGTQSSHLRARILSGDIPSLPVPTDLTTIICREQGVTLETIRTTIDAGAHDVNDLRRRTRAGMGMTSGRDVLPVLASLLLDADPDMPVGRLTGRHRPPARPVPFSVVLNTPEDNCQ